MRCDLTVNLLQILLLLAATAAETFRNDVMGHQIKLYLCALIVFRTGSLDGSNKIGFLCLIQQLVSERSCQFFASVSHFLDALVTDEKEAALMRRELGH